MKQLLLILGFLIFQTGAFAQEAFDKSSDSFFEKSNNPSEMKVYPNPCKNRKVTVELSAAQLAEIFITDIAGKVVFREKLEFPVIKQTIELFEVPNGIYLIQVRTTANKKIVKKLMVTSN